MTEAHQPSRAMPWPALVLASAIGAWLAALARATCHVLPDLHAQQTAAVLTMGVAVGQVVFALRAKASEQAAARAGALAGLSLPLATIAWLALLPFARTAPAVTACAALLAIPLGAASHAVAAELSAKRPGAPMAVWLAAASAGASCALLAIGWLGAGGVMAAACWLAALAALAYGRTVRLRVAGALALLAAMAASAFGAHLLDVPEQSAPPAELHRLRARATALDSSLVLRVDRWDMGTRAQVFELFARSGGATGLGALLRDSALALPLVRPRAGASLLTALCERTLLAVPYDTARPRVLIAGLAGGLEAQCALHHGSARVDVAEPSAAQREAIAGWLGDEGLHSGAKRLRFAPALGRAFAARSRTPRYDLAVLSSARGKHTLPAGVLPLPEALAETDRGLRELLSALAPSGALWAVVRGEPAALRLAATAHQALRALGARAPAGHLAVYRDGDHYGLLAARNAFGMDRVLELHARAKRRGAPVEAPALARLFDWPLAAPELVWTLGPAFANRFGELLGGASGPRASRLARTYAFDIAPTSDDRPLFHERTRRDRPDTWWATSPLRAMPALVAAALVVAVALTVLLAVRLRPRQALRSALALGGLGAGQTLFFAFWVHALSLWLDRPEHGFALTVLALPAFALMRLPWRLAEHALPWALSVHALAAAAAVPLAPALVLLLGHSAVAIATVLLFALAAAVSWYPPRKEQELGAL